MLQNNKLWLLSGIDELCVFDYVQHAGGDAASPEASPVKSNCGSCVNTATAQQQSIISMEEDEMSDQEVVSTYLLCCRFVSGATPSDECFGLIAVLRI